MGNLNYIVFGGVDSRDYGIYISGEGVFNAPERDVEVVNIPGKDGDLLIDKGRFLNIEVTYPGFNFEPDLSTFAERLRAFRAALASQIGYQRLEDSFHPDEFRLASFRSGLDINPVMYNTASTFDIAFDCKPQRFLKSGEEEIDPSEWGETETVSGSIATFEAESNTGIKSLVVGIEPNQSGSGDPSPSNVRPISGWDSIKVTECGKNLLNLPTYEEFITCPQVGNYYSYAIKVKPSTSYYLSVSYTDDYDPSGKYVYLLLTNNPSGNNPWVAVAHHSEVSGGVITSSADGYLYLRLSKGGSAYVHYPNIRSHALAQLEEGTSATSYEPYQGETITKPLGRTVYGGTLDLISGVLTVDKGYAEFDGSSDEAIYWNVNNALAVLTTQDGFKTDASTQHNVYTVNNIFADKPWAGRISVDGAVGMYLGQPRIYLKYSQITSEATARTFLASHPLQVAYKLQNPTEIQLTPEQIETLLGVNNIWADSGEVSVEYGADPSVLINPTPFESLPLIEVTGTGTLTVGDVVITIDGEASQVITLDSDMMEAYAEEGGAIVPKNDLITINGNEFPKLDEETGITYTGLTSVKVTPRWWTI